MVTPTGRLGTVSALLYGWSPDTPDALVVRIGLLRRREILVDIQDVAEVIPLEGKVLLSATPGEVDLPGDLKGRLTARRDRDKPAV